MKQRVYFEIAEDGVQRRAAVCSGVQRCAAVCSGVQRWWQEGAPEARGIADGEAETEPA